jgi:monothiol glutaredoxin
MAIPDVFTKPCFNLAGAEFSLKRLPRWSQESSTMKDTPETDIQARIREQIASGPVVLYMKGTPRFPQCGFSSSAVQTLKACGVTDFVAVNVLADEDIRQGIKAYANWPTIPQLYVGGEFVGGSDIMREMSESGELRQLLKNAGAIA